MAPESTPPSVHPKYLDYVIGRPAKPVAQRGFWLGSLGNWIGLDKAAQPILVLM